MIYFSFDVIVIITKRYHFLFLLVLSDIKGHGLTPRVVNLSQRRPLLSLKIHQF